MNATLITFSVCALAGGASLAAQVPPDLAAERQDYARWLEAAPNSPYAAIFHQPFHGELLFGPGGEPGLGALPPAELKQGVLRLTLRTERGERTVPRYRDVPLGAWRLRVSGGRDRAFVTVFGPFGDVELPGWYAFDPAWAANGVLEPPAERETRRMLGLDGIEVEASRAGTFVAELGGKPVRLVVFRMPEPGSEESELNIFFRDDTNGQGTYPAGRFLALRPLGGNRYRADFNRARNPFCAYNGVFPCPLPWRGNEIDAAVTAGEQYHGGGLEVER